MLTESEVLDVLERRMDPGGVLLRQVRSRRADGGPERTIDAVHVSLAPGRAHTVTAYEVKRSRADLRAELANVDKAGWWGDAADAFYLVVTDRAIVDGLEIPAGWGVLSVSLHGVREELPADTGWFGPREQSVPRNVLAALVDAARKTAPGAGEQPLDRSSLMKLAEETVAFDRDVAARKVRVAQEMASAWQYRIATLTGLSNHDAERMVLEAGDHEWWTAAHDRFRDVTANVRDQRSREQIATELRALAAQIEEPAKPPKNTTHEPH